MQVSDAERALLRDKLQAVHDGTSRWISPLEAASGLKAPEETNIAAIPYFKVRWTAAPDLVSSKRVFIKGGFAYVPRDKMVSIILAKFKTHVRK